MKTNFLGNDVPKEICIILALLALLLILLWELIKNHPQVYLEECKYSVKKIQISRFINTELRSDSDSEPDSEVESKSDAGFMAKLKSDSDSE